MKMLIFDLAFNPTVVLLDGDMVIGLKENTQSQNSDRYLEMVDSLLKENNLNISDVKKIVINIGPGSFTGLRVAISLAKGIGFAGDVLFSTFNSFDYVEPNQNIVVPGFSNFVYVKFADGTMICEDVASLDKSLQYVTFSELLLKKIQGVLNVTLVNKLGYDKICKKVSDLKKIDELEPLYLRKSQAEIQRENKLGVK